VCGRADVCEVVGMSVYTCVAVPYYKSGCLDCFHGGRRTRIILPAECIRSEGVAVVLDQGP
jgi:hypothetical protein